MFRVVNKFILHTVPQIICLVNSFVTNAVLSRQFVKPIFFIGMSYIVYNFISTKILGHEPYHAFMHWNNGETPCLATGLLFLICFIYILLCKIDEKLKAHSLTAKVRVRNVQKQYTYKVQKDETPFLSDKRMKERGVPKVGMDPLAKYNESKSK